MSVIGEVLRQYNALCQLLPPGATSGISTFLANLPLIILFLVTTPVRFFLCIFSTITKINVVCAIINLIPPVNFLLPFISAKTTPACNTQCQYCVKKNITCINYFPQLLKYFNECTNQMSILNKIFCLLGIIIADMLNPFLVFVNPLIYLATNKMICLNTDPSICGL